MLSLSEFPCHKTFFWKSSLSCLEPWRANICQITRGPPPALPGIVALMTCFFVCPKKSRRQWPSVSLCPQTAWSSFLIAFVQIAPQTRENKLERDATKTRSKTRVCKLYYVTLVAKKCCHLSQIRFLIILFEMCLNLANSFLVHLMEWNLSVRLLSGGGVGVGDTLGLDVGLLLLRVHNL